MLLSNNLHHFQTKATHFNAFQNMWDCPWSLHCVVNKALSFELQTKNYYNNNSLPILPAMCVFVCVGLWVGVCMHAAECPGEGFVYVEVGTGDFSWLIICKYLSHWPLWTSINHHYEDYVAFVRLYSAPLENANEWKFAYLTEDLFFWWLIHCAPKLKMPGFWPKKLRTCMLEANRTGVRDFGVGWACPLSVWTARVIKNWLSVGLRLIAGDRRKGIARRAVDMGITPLSGSIMWQVRNWQWNPVDAEMLFSSLFFR